MVHGALRRQARDRRQHAEGIGAEHHDVLGMTAHASELRLLDEVGRVRRTCVLGQRGVRQIQNAGLWVSDHVLKHGPKATSRGIDLGLRLGREIDDLGVTAPFAVEDSAVAPAVFVIANQSPGGIAGQCGLAGPREPEEQCRVAAGADVRGAMHRQHSLQWQGVVED